MSSNLFLLVPGIIFISVLLGVYFSKRRLVSAENKIYVGLITTSLVSLLLSVLNTFITSNTGVDSLTSVISAKVYLASVLVWLALLTIFIYAFSFKKMEKFSMAKTSSLLKILWVIVPICVVCLATIFILPLNIVNGANAIYFDGLGISFLYIITFICAFIWFLRYVTRIHFIKRNKSNFILFILFSVLVGTGIQVAYPELFILTFVTYFVTFIMYFGIDNPDLDTLKELDKAKKAVEEAEVTAKDSLLKASHEIRTPLNAIVGFSQSILEGTSEDIMSDIKHISTASERLSKIVDNIFDVSDADMGMYKLVFVDYDFNALLEQIVSLAKEKMTSKKVAFNVMVDDNIPPFLFGDSVRIKEIILNIFCNAIKYTKEGYINLDISCITVGNICRLMISVRDTGIGMTDDQLEKLFESKLNENKMLTEGINELNLSAIKEIVESMNGQMTVESEYREGTNVTIIVDQKIGKDSNATEQSESKDTDIMAEVSNFSGKRILIVDDDSINLKVATRLLKTYNVITEEVPNGYKCLEKINSGEHYDLIFLDDWMPNMSGVETLKNLDRIKGFNTPVVALTANAMSGMKKKYLKDGFSDFIPKPIERNELDRVMKKFLSNN